MVSSAVDNREAAREMRLEPIGGGKAIPLDKAVLFFGRHPDCDVRLAESPKVSRRHCCIAQVNDRWVIRDLGSLNGVKVNGAVVAREADLKPGDEVTIGEITFTLAGPKKR